MIASRQWACFSMIYLLIAGCDGRNTPPPHFFVENEKSILYNNENLIRLLRRVTHQIYRSSHKLYTAYDRKQYFTHRINRAAPKGLP